MGWLFGWSNRSDLIHHLVSGNGAKTLTHCCKGNVLWAVQELPDKAGVPVRFIACYLMKGAGPAEVSCRWGYKDMDESMHPYYYTCPVSYFKLTPVTNQAWRDEVLARTERGKRRFKLGDVFQLYGKRLTVTEVLGRRGYRVSAADSGVPYRVRLSQIKDVVTVQDEFERTSGREVATAD
jgi:hypothetical protein